MTSTTIPLDAVDRASASAANAEVEREIGDLCQTLGVSLGAMKFLPMPAFAAFVAIRMFKKLSVKIRELDARLEILEAKQKDTVQ